MLIQSQLSEKHWDDAIRTACYLLNRTLSTKNTEMTPFEVIFKKKPSLHHVKIFGCRAMAHVMTNRNKWDPKAIECVLVGYNSSNKNYILYVSAENQYIQHAKHVSFVEESIVSKNNTCDKSMTMDLEDLRITDSTVGTLPKIPSYEKSKKDSSMPLDDEKQ